MDNYDYLYMSDQSDHVTIHQLEAQIEVLQRRLWEVQQERDRLRDELEAERREPTPDDRDRY